MNTTIISNTITNFLGALVERDERNYFIWLPEAAGVQLAQFATAGGSMQSSVEELVESDGTCLEEKIGDRKGRALVFQGVRALVMSAGYRAHNVLSRIKLNVTSSDSAVREELARYASWATGRELSLEDYLLGGVSFETRAKYKAMVEAGELEDARVQLLLDEHRVVQQAVRASWGMVYAKQLSDWADRHGQMNPMIDAATWARSTAKLKILDGATKGRLPLAGI